MITGICGQFHQLVVTREVRRKQCVFQRTFQCHIGYVKPAVNQLLQMKVKAGNSFGRHKINALTACFGPGRQRINGVARQEVFHLHTFCHQLGGISFRHRMI